MSSTKLLPVVLLPVLIGTLQAQPELEVILDLTITGKYEKALIALKTRLEQANVTGYRSNSVPLVFAYLGRVHTEIGELERATDAFRTAEAVQRNPGDSWHAVLARERASLHLARFDFASANDAAACARKFAADAQHYRIRVGYVQALLATAQIRLGQVGEASAALDGALDAVPKNPETALLFAPRILYAAALLEAHRGHHQIAREHCERAIRAIERATVLSRDLSLGWLTLGEVQLLAGDVSAARESTSKGIEISRTLFGSRHPDTITGLLTLARVDLLQGRAEAARAKMAAALKFAVAMFGNDAPGTRFVRQIHDQINAGRTGLPSVKSSPPGATEQDTPEEIRRP